MIPFLGSVEQDKVDDYGSLSPANMSSSRTLEIVYHYILNKLYISKDYEGFQVIILV